VGGSDGGLDAYIQLLRHLPADLGMAIVIVNHLRRVATLLHEAFRRKAHAIVLSVDEKSQIQALDRTQGGLPMKKVRAGTMTHDYKRHRMTTPFAAMNVLDGTVIDRNMQRHRLRSSSAS
jgi:CheB methylesterase